MEVRVEDEWTGRGTSVGSHHGAIELKMLVWVRMQAVGGFVYIDCIYWCGDNLRV